MELIEQNIMAKEFPQPYRKRIYGNINRNGRMTEFYKQLLVEGIVKKRMSPSEIHAIRERIKRLDSCNKFWLTETYEESHVKVLLKTYLCKDKFCSNCNQMKKVILQNRFLPYMEKYKDSLYHIVLTVPDCAGENLRTTIQRMASCFKTLVSYLNGNKKVKGINLTQYGFQGCIRSLEITYKEDIYHPHFHVAAVLGNSDIEKKHLLNTFSGAKKRMFSEFEIIIQRMWWLLLNQKRLTSDNILGENNSLGRYSCTADKFNDEDFKKLFGYMTKMYDKDNSPMTYKNFKTLYHALFHIRQIQGYGVFYNMKEFHTESYTEQDYQALENYLIHNEQPINAYEPICRLATDDKYTTLKLRYKI